MSTLRNETLQKAWNMYKDVLFGIPYNSISQLYIYLAKQEVPLKLGLPCALQLNELVNRFRKAEVNLTGYQDLRHGVIISELEGTRFLFDPYLLHSEPVNLDTCKTEAFYNFNAYPIRLDQKNNKQAAIFKVQYKPLQSSLKTVYSQFQPNNDKYKTMRSFRFDLNKTVTGLPPEEQLISLFFHPEQTTLSMRVLCEQDEKMYQLIYPICWYHGQGKQHFSNLLLKLNSGEMIDQNNSRFKFYYAKIANTLSCSKQDLQDFIMGGVDLYEKHAPSTIPYHEYKPIYS